MNKLATVIGKEISNNAKKSNKKQSILDKKAKLGNGLGIGKHSFLDKKAEEYAQIPMVEFIELLDNSLKSANDLWGSTGSIELAQAFSNFIAEVGNDKKGPDVIADNYVVNGEFVEKAEFTQNGEWQYYFELYKGNWDALCDDAIVYNDNFALMRY